jgi:hypothetical protein
MYGDDQLEVSRTRGCGRRLRYPRVPLGGTLLIARANGIAATERALRRWTQDRSPLRDWRVNEAGVRAYKPFELTGQAWLPSNGRRIPL